jgi:hypothetical protein
MGGASSVNRKQRLLEVTRNEVVATDYSQHEHENPSALHSLWNIAKSKGEQAR